MLAEGLDGLLSPNWQQPWLWLSAAESIIVEVAGIAEPSICALASPISSSSNARREEGACRAC